MRWFRSLIFLIISLGYFSDLFAGKITMNSTCAYCGDRFICGAINEVVKLKFNFSKKSETAKIKDHCETLSITTSERIKAEGTKSESDLRHETTKAYIEEIVLRSKKKRKSDSLRKRFEKGVKLGELKYYSQPDKKSSQKVYKKLVQARLVIPLKSFDDYKSTYPERATLNYRTYVKDILTQDPYHLSTKGNYEGYYTFALYPDGDVLKANQALVRNTASVGGSLGGGGSGGGSSGGAPKAGPNAEVMRAPAVPGGEKLVGGSAEAESSPKATLNDQGQWVVENRNSNKTAKPVDMRVLNNASGSSGAGSGGTDFGAGSDLMNFYKTGNESASTNSGTQRGKKDTKILSAFEGREELLSNTFGNKEKTVVTGNSTSDTKSSSSSFKSRSVSVSSNLESESPKSDTTVSRLSNSSLSTPSGSTSDNGIEVSTGSVGSVEQAITFAATDRVNRGLNRRRLTSPEVESIPSVDSTSEPSQKIDKASEQVATGDGLLEKEKGAPKRADLDANDEKDRCNDIRKFAINNHGNAQICGNEYAKYIRCEVELRSSILKKCENLFKGEFPLEEDLVWVSDGNGDLTSVQRCAERFEKLVQTYMPRKAVGQIKTNLITNFYEHQWAKKIDVKRFSGIEKAISRKTLKNYSDYYCSNSEKKLVQREAVVNLISIYIGKPPKVIDNNCEEYVNRYIFGIMRKYRDQTPSEIESSIATGVFSSSVLNDKIIFTKNDKEQEIDLRNSDPTLKKEVATSLYKMTKDLYNDLKLYMEPYELKNYVKSEMDSEVGVINVIERKIENNVSLKCVNSRNKYLNATK